MNVKTILLTGTVSSKNSFSPHLEQYGYKTIHLPLIETTAVNQSKAEEELSGLLYKSQVVMFFSKEAVIHLSPRMLAELQARNKTGLQIMAVGDATAGALSAAGFVDIITPQVATAKAALEWLAGNQPGPAIAFRSDISRDSLEEAARNLGLEVKEIRHYTTIEKQYVPGYVLAAWNSADAVLFASPSAVRSFKKHWRNVVKNGKRILLIAIGPSTAAEMEEEGVKPEMILEQPTPQQLHHQLSNFAL